MKQVGARHDIIREWRSLPKELRQTDEQAEAFAMQIKDKYRFSSDSADPYQTARGWLLSYLSLRRVRHDRETRYSFRTMGLGLRLLSRQPSGNDRRHRGFAFSPRRLSRV